MTQGLRAWAMAAGCVAGLLGLARTAGAQYFGQNKVQYRTFDFRILKTDHFDIYYYPEEADAATLASRLAERWYSRLSRFFSHELRGRQVVILYAASPHFRQTNAVEGLIGEGTGGVTESLKRRVVLPMGGSLADTNHVLGHELVHAFQYDITGSDTREAPGSVPGIEAYPLWFVEGMAEYLSIGPVDPQTAMWLRDAALREKLPSIKALEDPKYFPYRWGQAFWAYIGGRYGDRAIASLVRSAANPRFDLAGLTRQLGTDPETLTEDWHRAIRQQTNAALADRPPIESEPRLAISRGLGGGRYNIGPRLSPDGREIAYFSERDRFAIELYLADAETGKVDRKLLHTATDPHFDSLEFLDSAGAWSPDGKTIAITALRSGQPELTLIDPRSGDIVRELKLPDLDEAIDPAFSPDGRFVALSGNRGGMSDLYLVSLATGRLEALTQDPFADLEPTFTPDGRSLVFVTERYSTDLTTLQPGPLRLARLDLATRAITPIPGFLRGKHLSPQVSADGRSVTFIAEPDGISNLYRMPIDGGPILQLTAVPTGVAGITASSPALSAAPSTGRLAFSVFEDDGDSVYVLDPEKTVGLVSPELTDVGATLAGRSAAPGDVERLLHDPVRGLPSPDVRPPTAPDPHPLKLDALAQPTVSAGVSQFGGFVGGGMAASFSDMLGDRELSLGGFAGGKLVDFQGQIAYANRRHRWNWAVAVAQVSNGVGFINASQPAAGAPVTVTTVIDRQTGPALFGLTAFPLSKATRLEFIGDVRSLAFSEETLTQVFTPDGLSLLSRQDVTSTIATPLRLAEGSTAFVHDTAYFGATSPIYGERYRIEVGRTEGTIGFSTLTLDWRRYFMPRRPITIAIRALHVGRYGSGADDPHLVPLFAGYSDLVHGYGFGSITPAECPSVQLGSCPLLDNLAGSRLLVGNIEVRAPLMGLLRGDLQYGRVPVEVAAFMDGGVTWTSQTLPTFLGGTRDVVRSVGGAARLNVFGFAIVELAVSHPFDRPDRHLQWQLGLVEGF
jgi:hypothetical protein